MATQPSILAWRIPMDRGAWQAPSGKGLSYHHTRHGHRVHLSLFLGVPASNDDSCHQVFSALESLQGRRDLT